MELPKTEIPVANSKSNRIESLDSIRGLAALAVLLGHTVGTFEWPGGHSWTSLPFINIMFDGRSAVTMFFVLSGFVLARPYFATAGQSHRQLLIPAFYIRRITRIWIPWFIVFCLSIFAKTYLFKSHVTNPPTTKWLDYFWHSPMTLCNFLRQCVFSIANTKYQLLPQDWSLGVELKGSALIPVFLFLNRKHLSLLLGFATLLLILLPTGEYYVSFAVGVLMARFYASAGMSMGLSGFTAKLWILITGLLLYQMRLPASQYLSMSNTLDKVIWCATSAGCAFILAASLSSRRIQTVLNHRAIIFLGRISYSVYLLQFIVLLCFLPPAVHTLNVSGIQSTAVLLSFTVVLSVLATVACAAIAYHVVEVPSIEFGHRLTKRYATRFIEKGSIPGGKHPMKDY